MTTGSDLARAEALIETPAEFPGGQTAGAAAAEEVRTGLGFDVHRFGPHPPGAAAAIMLGGIAISHDQALMGHSDADVALHALTDALLGALGAGDIGMHFPPTDPAWRGVSSDRFLAHAAALLRRRGGRLLHVDLTLVCERPKIGPHRAPMVARIAAILDVPEARVSVKATTTEGLGFTGRREGIAAQAVATIVLPPPRPG
jgi:2-C-methyl-D-erythritol 4-phosphate cytidylyltransferase/2-C-methyl-D-erythritol 2,4-cyclodiphosphate synthase